MPATPTNPDRRRWLDWVLGSWFAGVCGAVFFPVVRYLSPPEISEPPTLTVKAGPAATLAPNTGRLVPFGQKPALVVRLKNGELRAFAGTCTHLACTVQYRPDLEHIWCACHNGHYDLTGRNISGPPPKPLDSYEAHEQGDEIVISRRT
ncbi:MAG: Rieske (2Fe-2S) protein [Acidimicrobiia bacterium]|nr:Rieske (2Fe-2S) protein [Acidimicrobiia bacterium]